MIRNIVFDMGMVLMDYHSLEACRAAAPDEESALKVYAALFDHPEWVGLDDGSVDEDDLARHAMARLTDEPLRPLVPQLLRGMPQNVLSPMPGMPELVDWVFSSGFRVYLLSNAGYTVSQNRQIIPRIDRFHGVVFSADERMVKPDPALYQVLTDRYRLKPDECLFIDDNPLNTEAARKLGWQAHLFDGNQPALRRVLEACARDLAD